MVMDHDERTQIINDCIKMIEEIQSEVEKNKLDDPAVQDGYLMACNDIIFTLKNRFPTE